MNKFNFCPIFGNLRYKSLVYLLNNLESIWIIVFNQAMAPIQNLLCGAVISCEYYYFCFWEMFPELNNIAYRRTTETVNRLVIIPHYVNILRLFGKKNC